MAMRLRFSGATGTVTGSHYVLDHDHGRLLLDCGLYQGERAWRERNWQPFAVPPQSIDSIVLSHAHIDHSGYLPRLLRDGCRAPVYASPPTKDLCALLLPDSARLQEEEAEYRNRKGKTKYAPALPLYTEEDADRAVKRIHTVPFDKPTLLERGVSLTLRRAGHILGSSTVSLTIRGTALVFSGDLGRSDPPVLAPPRPVREADYLMIESTYGDREHEDHDPMPALARAVDAVVATRGVLVIPAFAVGRTQEVLYLLRALEDEGRIPVLPVAVDSPMATDVTELFARYPEELDPTLRAKADRALRPQRLRFTPTVEQSKALNEWEVPAVIISASGMATGGRILHHLARRLPDRRNVVLLVGYQGAGTRGRSLLDGADTLRIFGEDVPVNARVIRIDGLSAHADADEIIDWLRGFARPPRRTFLIHGEDDARAALAERIHRELGWQAVVPTFDETVELP